MDTVLIRFLDAGLQDFQFATGSESDLVEQLNWQSGQVDSLKDICGNQPVILLLPQELVLNTAIELPEKASRQLLSAIEYQVEDRLAQDVEDQHVARVDDGQSPLAVAIVTRQIMDRCLFLANVSGIRLRSILSEAELCPFESGVIRVEESGGRLLLRTGNHSVLKTEVESLAAVLNLASRDTQFRVLKVSPTLGSLNLPEGWQQETGPSVLSVSDLQGKSVINLLQRDYRLSSPVQSIYRHWRWAALFLLGFALLFAYNTSVSLKNLESEVAALKQQQYQLARPYLAADVTADDNLKTLLIREMSRQQTQTVDEGFLSALLDFSKARSEFGQISVNRITFQRDTLRIDLLAGQLNLMEDLLQTVRRSASDASLDDLSVKPGEVSATLVIPGGSDV